MRIIFIILLLFNPLQTIAWDDAKVLAFIVATNPIIQSQHQVSQVYAVPSALNYVLENTTFSGKAGFGDTDFRETPYTVF